jgi:D-glycero-alpha-D-manno-heptose 1-phosphate guanylyltransferase
MEAIILAGGLGTRLAGRVQGIPKSMAPVGGRPFLEILLAQLERCGCSRVVLSVGYLREVIQAHFGTSHGGMQVAYAVEETPLGTGGAIRKSLCVAAKDAALVLNGDTFLDADYAAMMRHHRASGAAMTMAITRQPDIARYGGVIVENGRVTGFEEKGRSGPGWINAGAYVLNRNSIWPAELGERFSFEGDYLARQVNLLQPLAFEIDGFFLDIGVPQDYDRAQTELRGW